MNYKILAKVLGFLLLLLSVTMSTCAVFAKLDPLCTELNATFALFTSAGVTFLAGAILILTGMGKFDRIPRREGVVIVGLGWVLSTIFGALPYMLCDPHLDWSEALFESASGFTTTGSTVISDLSLWPRGILLWRSATQWLGGIGILVLFVAVLSYLGVASKSLFQNESSFRAGDASTARIRDTALTLLKIYLGLTVACMGGLRLLGLSWFNAVAHAMTTVSTGGFSPHNASVGYYADWGNGWAIELWLSIFMVLCSLNFLIFAVIAAKNWNRLRDEDDARWFLGITVGVSLAIALGLLAEVRYSIGFLEALRESWFIVVEERAIAARSSTLVGNSKAMNSVR